MRRVHPRAEQYEGSPLIDSTRRATGSPRLLADAGLRAHYPLMNRVQPVVGVLFLLTIGGLITATRLVSGLGDAHDDALLMTVLQADDRRDGAAETLAALQEGARSEDPEIRRLALRAIGRAENADWLAALNDFSGDPDPLVRAEVANGLAQSVFSGERSDAAFDALRRRLESESHPVVRGVLVQSLGRLRYATAEAASDAETAMLDAIDGESDPQALVGAMRGFESLARQQRAIGFRLSDRAVVRLGDLSELGRNDTTDENLSRTRRMSLAALIAGERASQAVLRAAFDDPDAGVRRLAVLGSVAFPEVDVRAELIMDAPDDESGMVRYEIIRAFSRTMMDAEGCIPLSDALADRSPHVTLQVLDAMASCSADEIVPFLIQVFASLPPPADTTILDWHHPIRAFMSLVRVSPDLGVRGLNRLTEHSQWQVRVYGAQAAAALDQTDVLYAMAADAHHNVRTAVLQGLAGAVGHEADSIYIRNLASTDYQLVMTAARLLAGTPPTVESVAALFGALDRITAEQRQTSRDARVGIITRIGELGSRAYADRLRDYLSDFDPVIADSSAAIIGRWTEEAVTATPRPLGHQPLPSLEELREWEHTTATLHMKGLGEIVIGFRPFDAPTNVARFIRLAESGFFDGLTFHRVVPNFVIQGGSPGANEYAGDGPYTRDELTRCGHWRGTVGLSTRGRDTGDGQLFINLADNVRLDHNYTIFGHVVNGMEVVDAVVEGAVIERVVVARSP